MGLIGCTIFSKMSLARCAVAAVSVSCWLSAASSCRGGVASVSSFNFARSISQEVAPYTDCNMYLAEERGSLYSADYRIYFRDESGPISPVHDIPMWADKDKKIYNMVVEVPRWTNAKMEMSMTETLNPIKQDTKKGALRFVANVFPHHGYIWNYGAIPQTWESPKHIHPDTQARGDNDPIDVIEIGDKVRARGEVVPIKAVGVMALLDEGETDWKVIGIAADEPDAALINDVADLQKHRPGLLRATVEWFRLYKVPDGKPENKFAFDGQAKDAAYAHKIIEEVHADWRELVGAGAGGAGELATSCVVAAAARVLPRDAAAALLAAQPPLASPQPIPPQVDKWHYLSNL